jgi:ornithine--oxo-acid transaminase
MTTTAAAATQGFIQQEDHFGAHNYHPLDIVIAEAQGAWVTDVEGKRFLDCLSAYSAVNQGHCHPRILQAMLDQAHRVTLTSRAFRNDQLPLLCERLATLSGMDKVLPMNSGAEAVETAIKAVRRWGYTVKGVPDGQAEIIVCSSNFHGRTTAIISFSTEADYRDGFGPFLPGFKVVEYGDVEAFRAAITPNTVGFLVEPIQGEAGIHIPPDGYLKACFDLCQEHRVLFMADEIQCGLGRAGKLFAYQYEGITPEIVIIGKALSGGFYPVSAMLSNAEVMGVFRPGTHGSTFGGNPLACAVALAALDVLVEERLPERSAELGAWLIGELRQIDSPRIKEVRGRGLMIGIELHEKARPYCEALKERGMLCKETHGTVIRVTPPLIISKEDLAWALQQLRDVLTA